MLFRLVVKKNGKRIRVLEARTPITHVGRAHGNDIRIPSGQVSRKHCRLQMKNGLVMVEDLGSVNGTFLNDSLLTGVAVVRPGDHLDVGPVKFVVEYQLTPAALKRLDEMEVDEVEGPVVDDMEVVEEDRVLDVEEASDKVTQDEPLAQSSRRPTEAEDVIEVEEEYVPRNGLEDISFAPSDSGDLRDVLAQLDEGQESLAPKKRPGPRKPSAKRRPEPEE